MELDELIGLPLLEDKRAASNRVSIKEGVPHGELFKLLPRLSGFLLQDILIQKMFRQDPYLPCAQGRGVKSFVNDPDGERIDLFHLFDRFIIGKAWGDIFGIHDGVVSELYISCFEGMAVMKFHTRAQVKDDDRIVLRGRQDFICILDLFPRLNFRVELKVFLRVECLEKVLPEDDGKAFKEKLIHVLQNKFDLAGAFDPYGHFSFLVAALRVFFLSPNNVFPGRQNRDRPNVFERPFHLRIQ